MNPSYVTKVWRVQDINGRGPYNNDSDQLKRDLAHRLRTVHSNDDLRPDPCDDFTLAEWRNVIETKAVFGFLCKSDAIVWFDGFWGFLEIAGFDLVEVEGEVIAMGEVQVAFVPIEREVNV